MLMFSFKMGCLLNELLFECGKDVVYSSNVMPFFKKIQVMIDKYDKLSLSHALRSTLFQENDKMKRAELVLVNADKMKCRKFVRASVSARLIKQLGSPLICTISGANYACGPLHIDGTPLPYPSLKQAAIVLNGTTDSIKNRCHIIICKIPVIN